MVLNLILCLIILAVIAVIVYFVFFKRKADYYEAPEVDLNDYDYLKKAVKEDIAATIRMRPEDLNLNAFETKKQKKQIDELKKNLRL